MPVHVHKSLCEMNMHSEEWGGAGGVVHACACGARYVNQLFIKIKYRASSEVRLKTR